MTFEQYNEQQCLAVLLNISMYEDRFEDWDRYKITRQDINARLAQIRESK